jgi:putative ABC transport system permease protein
VVHGPSFILLAILVGLLSGSYPSFVLASFKPIFALKGNPTVQNGTTWLRNALVIVQFSIAIIIIAGTLVIYWQFKYMTNKELGFDKEQLVVMDRIHPLGKRIQTFKEELTAHSSIISATNSTAFLGSPSMPTPSREAPGGGPVFTFWTDEDFMETHCFGLHRQVLLKGVCSRFGSRPVNEAAVRKYNIEDP